jgi:hypothetical protein
MISPLANKTKKLKTRNICAGNLIGNETDICKTRLVLPSGICFANNKKNRNENQEFKSKELLTSG